MMTMALSLLIVLVPLQMFIGDQHGLVRRGPGEAAAAPIEAGRPQLPVHSLPSSRQSEEVR